MNLDVAVEDTVFTVAVDRQLARAGNFFGEKSP